MLIWNGLCADDSLHEINQAWKITHFIELFHSNTLDFNIKIGRDVKFSCATLCSFTRLPRLDEMFEMIRNLRGFLEGGVELV